MERNLWLQRVVGVSVLFATTSAQALDFDFRSSLSTEYTDNARRTAEDQISERQDSLALNLSLSEQRTYSTVELDYGWSYQTFSEDSQIERSLLEGDANILLGREQGAFQFLINHNRRRSLIDPTEINLTSNMDERDQLTLQPRLNIPLSRVDLVSLSAQKTDVTYVEDSLRNSERQGGDIRLTHRLSSLDSLSISYSTLDIEYTEFDNYTYVYNYAAFQYQAQLRALSYDFAIGYNTVEQNGDEFGGIRYSLNLAYEWSLFTAGLEASREITDNSAGSGNSVSIGGDALAEGGFTGPDQYLREASAFFFNYSGLCGRCDLDFRISYEKEDYRLLTLNNSTELVAQVSLSYDFSQRTSASLSFNGIDQEFELNPSGSRDSKLVSARLSRRINDKFDVFLTLDQQKEKTANRGTSIENRAGLGLGLRY
ncbi:hypothetical protein QFX18_20640 [Saccharophagus degradans]|uniref:hypothetical protein n=1 Tax=Saccharophagus degradans TaxID=86304 RepID=UPI002477EFEB|nr:hypothetical protein [Saccharophagus degradans]WGO98417.1 hypothetical protein QFX18_20640 [Saccharophagus degradans]